ncbi:putative disks large-like protein [Cricetulus griseus]|uniref:Putative disks large-like protein n=1 Tax=Cricetulus griseus TaxID=10029 RepID=A0A061IGD2_CRIGR|nr:putative disks large-like protein [Cricetulus griseus]
MQAPIGFIHHVSRPYHKPNPFYEDLKLEHKQVMWELKIFENENTKASEKLSELTKVFYCSLPHSDRSLSSRLSALFSVLKILEEKLEILLKQKEMVIQEKDLTEKLQHYFDDSQMRSTQLQPELEQDTAQDESHLQKELPQQEPPAEPHPQQVLNSSDARMNCYTHLEKPVKLVTSLQGHAQAVFLCLSN